MKQVVSSLFQIGVCTIGCLFTTGNSTTAQITSDGTVNTQVNQNDNIAEITGGETRGGNLFHSFQNFSIPTGNEAFFNNASDISNIFSRVTGGNISNINGLIKANGSASLFLINPVGIIFGEGSRLDIGGSFYGSTASSILFEDGEFSAVDNLEQSRLTVNAPIGLGFRNNPGNIVNRSDLANVEAFEQTILDPEVKAAIFNTNPDSERLFADDIPLEVDERFANGENLNDILLDLGIITQDDFVTETLESITPIGLQVNQEKDFALIGGNILIERSAITAPGGRVTLGGVSQAGIVSLTESSFFFPEDIEKADVIVGGDYVLETTIPGTFQDRRPDRLTEINVVSDNGGFIDLQAHNLVLDGASLDLTLNQESSVNSIAGDINLDADSINVSFSNIGNLVAKGTIGNINLTANVITFDNLSSIFSFAENGIVGDINLTADVITFKEMPPTNLGTSRFSENSSVGSINFNATSINLDNSTIILGLQGRNNTAGGINFNADLINLDNNSALDIAAGGENTKLDDVNLNADVITLNNNSSILSRTFSEGTTSSTGVLGKINLTANDVSVNNNSVISLDVSAGTGGVTEGININTNSLVVNNQSDISTQTNELDAPNIKINAMDFIEVSDLNSSISSQTGGSGNSGNISINTPKLMILDGAQISANNFIIETFDTIPGEGLIRNILEEPQEGSGDAGTIGITAGNITLQDRGGITALSSAGEGGNINLRVDDILSLRNNSEISATAGELDTPGNGGNINIDSQFIIAFPQGNNDITANAFEGDGGNISIATEGIFGIQERSNNPLTNDITASSNAGISGDILITTPDINPVQGATELPTNVIVPEETTQQACEVNREVKAKNGLSITGKGGIPAEPGLPLDSLNVTISGDANFTSTISQPIETAQGKIQPARGVSVTESGEVILTAYPTNNAGDKPEDIAPQRIPEGTANCGRV